MTAPRDPDRLIHAFLMEGQTELADPVFDAVRATIEHRQQRVVIGPWRMPLMNKFVSLGLGAAAVVVALIIGAQVLDPPAPGGVGGPASPSPSPTATPTGAPSVASPSSAVFGALPVGPFVMSDTEDPVQITVDLATSGWVSLPDYNALSRNDDGLDAPESVGAALIAWTWPAGTGFHVYADPCRWLTTVPEAPATTPEEIATAFAGQAQTDATAPRDVTVGGYAGKTVTLQVPLSYEVPGATREEEFGDCDEDAFVFYGIEAGDGTEPYRNAQGPGQIDELWILDVGGWIVIIDAAYGPATPAELVEELRNLAESATFE
jgi:hypothetical protein